MKSFGLSSTISVLPILILSLLLAPICYGLQKPLAPASPAEKDGVNDTFSSLLDVFQIYKPPPAANSSATYWNMLLMHHTFAFSYGQPFVGSYMPPPLNFNTVYINLTVTSAGRQFDRLATMYLGDIEVFRTSTAEPTASGIVWTYTKDMSAYLCLWEKPQKLIFDLGNLVDDTNTGKFHVVLTATFELKAHVPIAADFILPLSSQRSAIDLPSAFIVPSENATTRLTFPLSVSRAVVSISACGQAEEEFWYSNALSPDSETFTNTTGSLFGHSPFREIQLLIDGDLAGVVWPFPIIFTGGIAPGFWRPLVGIDAFDLREPEVDITPFLPYLRDKQPHTFEIRVRGIDLNRKNAKWTLSDSVGSYWVVTGKVFLFSGGSNTTIVPHSPGRIPYDPWIDIESRVHKDSSLANETLSYTVYVRRNLWLAYNYDHWYQKLEFSSTNTFTSHGLTQYTDMIVDGFSQSGLGSAGLPITTTTFHYPLTLNTTYTVFPNKSGIAIDAAMSRGLRFLADGRQDVSSYTLVAGPAGLETAQRGEAHYSSRKGDSYSFGVTEQEFWQGDLRKPFTRDVRAVNGSVVRDSLYGSEVVAEQKRSVASPGEEHMALHIPPAGRNNVRALLGRGPGQPTHLLSPSPA